MSGIEFNINSPKQLGDVLFNKLNLPKPVKYGKGKTISTAVDVLEGLAAEHDVPRLVLEYRQLSKLKSTYVDALPALLNSCTLAAAHDLQTGGNGDGAAVFGESESAEHSDPHRTGPRDSRRVYRPSRDTCCWRPTTRRSSCGCWRTFPATRCWWRLSAPAKTFTP